MSEVATFVKVGATALVLAMIEDDALGDELLLANPVAAIRQVSHDPTLQRTILLRSGRRATALEIQWALRRAGPQVRAVARARRRSARTVGVDVLAVWEALLAGLERDPDSVADVVDWVAKRRLVDGYAERHGAAPRRRRGSRRSTCSTTTCAPIARWRRAAACARIDRRRRRHAGR